MYFYLGGVIYIHLTNTYRKSKKFDVAKREHNKRK